ncbi:type II toxin-antitoxin system RelE/ParE family toxin [Methylomonas sp. SURF-2]|uniref:Type II toxin-antitoxin system RelE/ParE family toxin n=1 Tax=Methylomonas subterranea TaxID=2952225 RepID=A0ABT1THR8_9GAMM|nr:type II toxin-antitoxin system RelE/ParE family toxin [Methylomonas sp. SURF-2]
MIVWSKLAREDLRLIHQYIAHDSKHYAARVVQDITEKIEVLRELPKLGRMVPEIGEENVREIGLYSYRILYELISDTIYIHGVIHRRRHFKPEDLPR